MKTNDQTTLPFLIVGQGIAGTLLAYFLLKHNHPFKIIDHPLPGATSKIAAGIINPITGRRMVKSWRFDELSQFARQTYQEIEALLQSSFYREMNILRALPTTFEQNEWDRRSDFPENKSFFRDQTEMGVYEGKVPPLAYGELKGASKADLPRLIQSFRNYLSQKGLFTETVFDFAGLKTTPLSAHYDGYHYQKIIFCEGHRGKGNPFFKYLPFSLSKGELLLVKIPGFQANKMLKNKIYLVPLGGDNYWVGSTNSFECSAVEPTKDQKTLLIDSLQKAINLPFEVVDHQAGIRPTIADKRPLLGIHPVYTTLAIFNGLGTKGASLGPYFAHQMMKFLLGKEPLDPAVDIARFPDGAELIVNR